MSEIRGFTHPDLTVSVSENNITVEAGHEALRTWATRPDHFWPCSELRDLAKLSATFDTGGLVDLETKEQADVSGDELSAFTSDAIAAVLSPDHPCFEITVGQFREDARC